MGISIKIGGGAASIPAASTSTEGKVRLATTTEATTGTATDIAVTPAGLAAAISGIAGGMTYKGFWDAINAVPDLSNAKQGDFYYISAGGTRYGKTWDVGDHLVVNEDMGGTITGAKLDKIDSTEMVSNLGDLLDVTITSPSNGQALTYDAATSQWVNSTLDISALQSELNTTQTGAGLGTDGTYTAPAVSNYLSTATSLKSADSLLDTALAAEATARSNADTTLQNNINSEATARANADTTLQNNINAEATARANAVSAEATARANADTSLQNEINTTQTGAGLGSDGTYTAPAVSNYLSTATSLKSADSLLDTALKALSDEVDTLGGEIVVSVNSITPVSGNVTLTATDITGFATVATSGAYADLSGAPSLAAVATSGAGADVTIAHTAVNYTAATTTLEAHLAGIDTQLGVGLVTSVNSIAPVGGDVTLTATDITGFAAVATSGAYADLSGRPSLATVATSGAYADLSGKPSLATVATSGAYADLSGKPSLSTVATSGAYADLSGKPSLVAVATSGAADDVSVTATPVNYTAASADVEAHLAGIDAELGTLGGSVVVSVNTLTPVSGDVTLTAQDIDTSHTAINYTAAGASITEHIAGIDGELGTMDTALQAVISDVADLTSERLYSSIEYVNNGVNDVQAGIDAATSSNTLVWCSPGTYGGSTVTLTDKDLIKLRAEGCGTGAFGIVELTGRALTISGASSTRNLVQGFQIEGLTTINGTQGRHALIDCQLLGGLTITNGTANFVTIRDCDIAGTVTIAATVTAVVYFINCNFAAGASISNSALAAQVIVANCGGVPAAALASVTMAGQSGLSDGSFRGFFSALTLPAALAFTGNTNQLTNGAGFITAATAPVTSVNTLTGAVTLTGQNTTSNHTAVNYTAATTAITSHLAGIDAELGTLGGSTVVSVNSITPVGGNVTLTATDITGFATVATSGAYADLSGTPSLATVATSGAYADLSGKPSLATVATSGAYSDLSGTPSLGTAAAEDVGTAVNDVVQLVDIGGGVAGLPAVDASNLTGLDYTNLTNVPTSFITSLEYITTQTPLTLVAGKHYIMANATDTLKVLTVPDSANGGDIIRITNWGLGRLKLTTGGSNTTFLLSGLDVVGGATAGEVFVESKCTVDLVGFDYTPAGLEPAWGVYFISSIEINTKGLTTSGQAIVYNATTKKLEGGSAGDFGSGYTPTNYTAADSKFDSHFAGIDTAIGTKAATSAVLAKASNLSDLADASTARTNLGLGTAATANTGTAAGNVVALADVGGVVKLPAVDGSQLTNLIAADAVYESKSANFNAAVGYHYSVSAASGNITATLPARSGVTNGKAIRFKLYDATNNLVLTPAGGDTIDGLASYTMTNPKQSITLVKGANDWEVL
jgi:hypothetical protein